MMVVSSDEVHPTENRREVQSSRGIRSEPFFLALDILILLRVFASLRHVRETGCSNLLRFFVMLGALLGNTGSRRWMREI